MAEKVPFSFARSHILSVNIDFSCLPYSDCS